MIAQIFWLTATISVTTFAAAFVFAVKQLLAQHSTVDGAYNRITGDYYKPLGRLLSGDVAEVGFTPRQAKNLRASRRRVFRSYLTELQGDFLTLHQEARILLRDSNIDRPDLAMELVKQYVGFHVTVLLAHGRLAAFGVNLQPIAVKELLASANWIHQQVEMLRVPLAGAA